MLWGTDVKLSQPILYFENEEAYAVFNLSWNNAWHNDKNYDAVWLFFKSIANNGGHQHIDLEKHSHEVVASFAKQPVDLAIEVSEDQKGCFIFPQSTFRGNIEVSLKIKLDKSDFKGINTRRAQLIAYGIEMVHIPQGAFTIGATDSISIGMGSLYQPNKRNGTHSLIGVEYENQSFDIAPNGDIYYQAPEGYEGDQTGILPGSFPKGVDPFYIMKYEPTEAQYVAFLNSLSTNQLSDRVIHVEDNYSIQGGMIVQNDNHFHSKVPKAPCKFVSWDDAMAFADWAGLRPMTELEYTKAARGTAIPINQEFPWNTTDNLKIQRLPNIDGELVMLNNWEENQLNDDTREFFGASYYWVLDLAGSLWERVITVGHPNGRAFTGNHGDGMLDTMGFANVEGWPIAKEETGGFGFRGGGFYGYTRSYHAYNPFSPIAYRPYGGWAGGARTNAYGTRFVRSGKREE